MCMNRLVIIAVMMKVISAFEKFTNFHAVLLWVTYFIIKDSHVLDKELIIKRDVWHIHASAVSLNVINLVYVN